MKFSVGKTVSLAVIFLVCFGASVLAAGNTALTNVRFHSGEKHDRLVFDLERLVNYKIRSSDDGKCIILDMDGIGLKKFKPNAFFSDVVQNISYEETDDGLTVKIYLTQPAKYRLERLRHPARIFVDVIHPPALSRPTTDEKFPGTGRRFIKPVPTAPTEDGEEPTEERKIAPINPTKPRDLPDNLKPPQSKRPARNDQKEKISVGPTSDYTVYELAPGLKKTIYSRWNDDGPVVAYFIEADKDKYELKPALDDGQIPGRGTVSYIADEYNAVAAVNASYFGSDGTIIGIMKIDGVICGTGYYRRSAMGIMPDGSIIFGQPTYNGLINIGGVSLPVSGVDVPRGADMAVVYNRFYGAYTGTNKYGREYLIKDGKVAAITGSNTKIPYVGQIVSVNGAAAEALKNVKKGDFGEVLEDLGGKWNEAIHVVGAGPCLVERGRIRVSSGEEEFLPDIAYGRAPRSAVGITAKGNIVIAVADGRSSESHGCTLTEWANLLREYGCREAINLDGGGSSAIVAQGRLLNNPSDGSERRVASALLILPKK